MKISVFFCSRVQSGLSFVSDVAVSVSRFCPKKTKCPTCFCSFVCFPLDFLPLESLFSPCALPVLRRRLLFFQFFSSPSPRLSHNPGMFFPQRQSNSQWQQMEVLTLCDFCPSVCSVLFFSPYPCPALTHCPILTQAKWAASITR